MLVHVAIEPLLRFFDEKPADSVGHASAVVAVAGEELGVSLLCHCFRTRGCRAERLEGPCKVKGRKGNWLDAWVMTEEPDGVWFYQVEVKNSSAHATHGKPLNLDAAADEASKYRRAHWDPGLWSCETGDFRSVAVGKVLERMSPPSPWALGRVRPLLCCWPSVHPGGAADALFHVHAAKESETRFGECWVFSMSTYLRDLLRRGEACVDLEMPRTARRLQWLSRLLTPVVPMAGLGTQQASPAGKPGSGPEPGAAGSVAGRPDTVQPRSSASAADGAAAQPVRVAEPALGMVTAAASTADAVGTAAGAGTPRTEATDSTRGIVPDRETNFVYLSALLAQRHPDESARLTGLLHQHAAPFGWLQGTKDIWCRDYMPVQVTRGRFMQFRYDPSYLRARTYARTRTNVEEALALNGIEAERCEIIVDGGNVVGTDGRVIVTDQILGENRGRSESALRDELARVLEAEVIWVGTPNYYKCWEKHADGIVRFVDQSTVLISDLSGEDRGWRSELERTLQGHGLEIRVLPCAWTPGDGDSAEGMYINYLQVGNLIVVPTFRREADEKAVEVLSQVYPDCHVEPMDAVGVANEGGALHCVTWNILR